MEGESTISRNWLIKLESIGALVSEENKRKEGEEDEGEHGKKAAVTATRGA